MCAVTVWLGVFPRAAPSRYMIWDTLFRYQIPYSSIRTNLSAAALATEPIRLKVRWMQDIHYTGQTLWWSGQPRSRSNILTDYKISYDRNFCIEIFPIAQAQPILTKFVLLNSQPRTGSNTNVLRYVSTWMLYGTHVWYKSCIKSAQGMCNYKFSLTCKVWKHTKINSSHYGANKTCENSNETFCWTRLPILLSAALSIWFECAPPHCCNQKSTLPPPSDIVRLDWTKEATAGCLFEWNGMCSRVVWRGDHAMGINRHKASHRALTEILACKQGRNFGLRTGQEFSHYTALPPYHINTS